MRIKPRVVLDIIRCLHVLKMIKYEEKPLNRPKRKNIVSFRNVYSIYDDVPFISVYKCKSNKNVRRNVLPLSDVVKADSKRGGQI